MTLEVITSKALAPTQHGFFTRKGGASSGIFAGLNCGLGSSDQAECVAVNRSRAARELGVSSDALVTLHQVHSADVAEVNGPLNGQAPKADALVSASPGVALAVLTADCQPVLFYDAKARVIGAAHAGWKGALGGVINATVDAMENLGAKRADIYAVIGPTISQRAYEVGPDFFDDITSHNPGFDRFFAGGAGDRMQFDLPGFGLFLLREAGVGHAEWTGHCTYSDPLRFYSYRRSVHESQADFGRLLSAISLSAM